MKPFWRLSVISKFQSHIWVPQHGNAIYLQHLQMQYLPLCDGTCGPQYTLYSSPPPALLPVVESGFGLVPHKIHQHLHNSLYHSGKKRIQESEAVQEAPQYKHPEAERIFPCWMCMECMGMIWEGFVHGKGCRAWKWAAWGGTGVTTPGDVQEIHITLLVIAKHFCSWNHLQHQGLFSLSRYLLRLSAAGAEHCTAVFQEIKSPFQRTASLGSSLMLSGKGSPAIPPMKGAPCTPQTSTLLPWEVGRRQKVSGMHTVTAGWSPKTVTLEHCL